MSSLRNYHYLPQLISLFFVICQSCTPTAAPALAPPLAIQPGAHSTASYFPLLEGKRVGLVVNHTSMIGQVHLVDSLLSAGITITRLYAPEHGLRGLADAGATISDGVDPVSGVPIISLYGSKKKPSAADLEGIDILVFDMQDVGVRFYTYISTLHYILQAGAEQKIPVVVLDRPNPNGHYIDGPILDTTRFSSFVGMHPIPVVYGMTNGELAQMILGEGWLSTPCDLTVVPCSHYDHTMMYSLPVRPSPNLPNLRSVLLYPGICFFEGTTLSLGRGTSTPFQVVGHPDFPHRDFSFTPLAVPGAMSPPLKDQRCYGLDLSGADTDSLFQIRQMDIHVLLQMYAQMDKTSFFNTKWFDTLAGTSSFREAIVAGWNEDQIRASWTADLERFKERRKKYLLYPDFE